jgi:hypothetical protein
MCEQKDFKNMQFGQKMSVFRSVNKEDVVFKEISTIKKTQLFCTRK